MSHLSAPAVRLSGDRMRWVDLTTAALVGGCATVFFQICLDRFIPRPLSAGNVAAAGVTGAILSIPGHLSRRLPPWPRAGIAVALLTLFSLGLYGVAFFSEHPLSWCAAVYTATAAAVVIAGAEFLAGCTGGRAAGERLRLLALVTIAVAAVRFYLTPVFIGYLDARWYAYMYRDFLDQWRNGYFPFVGQTEFAINGAVHPIRSAPMHMFLGGVVDTLSLHQLSPLAVEHATIVLSAVAGTCVMYWTLLTLAPQARWRAAAVAALYILCPAFLSPLYAGDMFMMFMTLPALPLIVVGNALRGESVALGRVLLATGLALVWYCHPPTAMWYSLLTLLIQAGRLSAAEKCNDCRSLALAAVLFAGLSAYYFATMVEVPYRESLSPISDFVQLGAMIAVVIGLHRFLSVRRIAWLAPVGVGLLTLWFLQAGWFLWAGIATSLILIVAILLSHRADNPDLRWEIMLAAFVFGACCIACLTRFVGDYEVMRGIAINREKLWLMLRPIPLRATRAWPSVQLGWTLLTAAGVVVVLALARKRTDLRWLVVPMAVISVPQFPVPRLAEFFVATFPPVLARIVGLTLSVREMPVLTPLVVVGAFLVVARIGSRRALAISSAVLAVGLCWSATQLRAFYSRGHLAMGSAAFTNEMFAPENVVTYHYNYDLLPIPARFREGVSDWRLETRLIDAHGDAILGPSEIARAISNDHDLTSLLYEDTKPSSPTHFALHPAFEVPAHDSRLLSLTFSGAPPQGRLLVNGGIHLEDDMLTGAGWHVVLGEQAHVPTVISLVNSGDRAAEMTLTYLGPDNRSAATGSPFAKATLLPFELIRSPIRVTSLLPYRAEIRAPSPGILESPRVYLPGYRARVDGIPTPVVASPDHLAAVPVSAGEHTVEIDYVGTLRVRLTFGLTLATWIGLVGFAFIHLLRRRAAVV